MRYDIDERGAVSNGAVFFELVDAPGDDAMVLLLGCGEHCPRER